MQKQTKKDKQSEIKKPNQQKKRIKRLKIRRFEIYRLHKLLAEYKEKLQYTVN